MSSQRQVVRLLFPVSVGMLAACQPERQTGPAAVPSQAEATTASYTFRDLGTLPGGTESEARDVNDLAVVVGWSTVTPTGPSHAFRWQNGGMRDLGTLGGPNSEAEAVNRDGVIVGWSQTSSGTVRAVRWMNGSKTNLGTLRGGESRATDINNVGVIVGWVNVSGSPAVQRAFIWKNGVMTDIGTLGGSSAVAQAISNGGVVVGRSRTASGEIHAFWWKDGVMHDMGNMGGRFSEALGVNTARQIVGTLGAPPDVPCCREADNTTPFLWYRGARTDLSSRLNGRLVGQATDISPEGIVVGRYEGCEGECTFAVGDAWAWEQGVLTFLPEPTPTGDNETLSGANAINAGAHLVGYAETIAGRRRAAMWRRR